jgi:hypothetical protein
VRWALVLSLKVLPETRVTASPVNGVLAPLAKTIAE